jgi:hypothetical protein
MKSLEKRVTDMLTVAVVLMTFGNSPMNAQTTTADIEVGTAKYAATYVRNSRPSARLALDTTSRGARARSAADVARLARVPVVFETRRVRLVRRGSCWMFDRELWLDVSLRDTALQRMRLERG